MKAILLCAGKGLRLRPYTNNIPKCLMPIKGKPLLEIWLEKLFSAGITNILINAHYLSDQVDNFINHSKYKKSITVVHEKKITWNSWNLITKYIFL